MFSSSFLEILSEIHLFMVIDHNASREMQIDCHGKATTARVYLLNANARRFINYCDTRQSENNSMKKVESLSIFIILMLAVLNASVSAALLGQKTVSTLGFIGTPGSVGFFSIRIADFMPVRDTFADMDDARQAGYFQSALDDLKAASSKGEITHVQLRLYWTIDRASYETMSYPYLGSGDSSQADLMNNWRSWYFGNPTPATGKSAIQRIREAGFKLEIGLSVSFIPGNGVNIPPPFGRYAREANFPGFNGSLFVQNYWQNVLRPVAEQASAFLTAGDIFFIGFENYYPEADHPRLHSSEYVNVIANLRAILPPGVLVSEHITGWYDDRGLGYSYSEGFLNIAYLAALDIIEPSIWTPWLGTGDLPATPEKIRDAHFINMRFDKIGTGYMLPNGTYVPTVPGRDFMNDARLIYEKWNTKILWNSGLRNIYGATTWDYPEQGGTPSPAGEAEQAAFWAGRILALANQTSWVAGQDFERYCERSTYTGYTASWRGRPAETAIMSSIRALLNL
jgi:hypothetical protein